MTQSSVTPRPPGSMLRALTSVVAVVAHPDDESFGLGAVLGALTERGVPVTVLCFTRGEASTLRDRPGDLAAIRASELRQAADVLGIGDVVLLDYPDGGLDEVDLDELAGHVMALVAHHRPSHLLVFDSGGITGHPDHVRATQSALAAAALGGVSVLAWALPRRVASLLNAEFGTAFAGREPRVLREKVAVSRARQWRAIECHRSQSADNPVLRRRLELLGDVEHLLCLHAGSAVPHPRREYRGVARC